MNVFDLAARLTLNKDDYDKGLDSAESKGSKFGKGIKAGAAVAGAAIAATGAAAVKLGKDFVDATADVANYGDNIDKMSQKMGISAEAYQEWDAVMQHSGTSIEALKPSMKTLANAAQEGAEEFEKLGISQEEVKNLSQEDLFSKVIEGLQNMEEGTERTAITSKLLGRGATELGALLNTSAEATQKMKDRVHELGGVMSNEAVKAAAKYQDTLQDMTTAIDGLKRNVVSEFLPAVTGVMDGLTELFTGNYDEGLEKISQGINDVVDKISEIMPKILEVGGEIVLNLATAIIDNLPQLAESSIGIVMKLADALIENLPTIVETGLQLILAISKGLTDNLPTLFPALEDAIWTIAETLTEPETLLMLVDTGLNLMFAILDGMIKSIPRMVEGVGTVLGNIRDALAQRLAELYVNVANWFSETFDKIKTTVSDWVKKAIDWVKEKVTDIAKKIDAWVWETWNKAVEALKGVWDKLKEWVQGKWESIKTWGKDLIDNFISGVKEKFKDIKEAFKSLGELIKSLIGFSEPKEGPLSDFHTYAPDMVDLFIDGVNSKKDELYNTVAGAFDFSDAITAPQYSRGNVPHGRYQRGGGATGGATGQDVQVNYNNSDITTIKDTLIDTVPNMTHRLGDMRDMYTTIKDTLIDTVPNMTHRLGDMRDMLSPWSEWLPAFRDNLRMIKEDQMNYVAMGIANIETINLKAIQEQQASMLAEIKTLKEMFTNGKAKAGVNILNARELAMSNV